MFRSRRASFALVVLSLPSAFAVAADGDALTLTLEQALAMARDRSPIILAARGRVEEARGRLVAAQTRLRGNPVLDGAVGRRTVDDDAFTDLDIGLMQGLGVAGRRRARMDGAEADIAREIAEAAETGRAQTRHVAVTFLRGLHARERVALLATAATIAQGIAGSAERRYQAGDVATLDVNLSAASLARARSEVFSARADETAILGTLALLLGLKPGTRLMLDGSLAATEAGPLTDYTQSAATRPDVVALTAAIDAAEADARLAWTFRRPEVDVGMRYEREEEADIVSGALSISLPLLDRGQGAAAEADARAARLVVERDALRNAAEIDIATAFETWKEREEAAAALEAVLPGIDESEGLATRSYETGQISLVDLLIVRAGLNDTRRDHLDKRLEAAIARIELKSSAGVLR